MDSNIVHDQSITLEDLSDPLEAVKSRLCADEGSTVLRSVIPEACKSEECIVGIDEAGRGPVLGKYVQVLFTQFEFSPVGLQFYLATFLQVPWSMEFVTA